MKIFVAGGTGVAGRRAVRALAEAGHEVHAAVRSREKAQLVHDLGGKPVKLDLFDPDAVRDAVEGREVVVNLATKIPPLSRALLPGAWAENDRIRTHVSENLVDAAITRGVRRVIQESIAFMYQDHGDEWIDEGVSIDAPPHAKSAVVAETHAQRFTGEGRSGVVLRFAQFYAADSTHTHSWVKSARRGLSPFVGPRDAFMSFIHAEDVGSAVVAALDAPAGIYNVADDDPPRQVEAAQTLARALGVDEVKFPPAPVMQLAGRKVRMYMRSQRVSNRRFRDATGWRPLVRDVSVGFPALVEEMGVRNDHRA